MSEILFFALAWLTIIIAALLFIGAVVSPLGGISTVDQQIGQESGDQGGFPHVVRKRDSRK